MRDIRYTLRTLARAPLFSVVAILTLALGIGANTAIFSAVDAVLLHPLPVPALDQLVVVREDLRPLNVLDADVSPGESVDLSARTDLFQASTAFRATNATLTGLGEPRRLATVQTMGDFFDTFGIHPALGRFYGPEDSREGSPRVAVLSHAAWQALAGGDPNFVGQSIELDDQVYQVIGVLPADVQYPRSAQLFVPFTLTQRALSPGRRHALFMTFIGRLRPNRTADQARTQLAAEVAHWHERYGGYESGNTVLHVTPFADYVAGQLRPILLVLLGAVGLVLLIACANVASLQLVRAVGRTKELTIRAALGAGRGRLVRQLLVESAVLTTAGGVLGVALGAVAIHVLARMQMARFQALRDVRLDVPTLAFTLLVSILAGVIFGTAPALRTANVHLNDTLREGARGSSGGLHRHRFLQGSTVVQVALTLVLLLGSALTIRSLATLLKTDTGFRGEHAVSMSFSLPSARYPKAAQILAFKDALLRRVGAMPGVEAAATAYGLPFTGASDSSPFDIVAHPPQPGAPERHANLWIVSEDYLRAMGIPLLRGRFFTAEDNASVQPVVVIDETLAKQFFPGENPVGQQIKHGGAPAVIIGVVGRIKHDDLTELPKASIYHPVRQLPVVRSVALVVRSTLPTSAVAAMVRSAIHGLDTEVPLFDVVSMHERVEQSLGARRLAVILLGGFAALSLLLALLGIYGVISYSVSRRTQEIGIRMALGARPGAVAGLVLRNGLVLASVGLIVGVLVFIGLGRLLGSLLYGVSPRDPITIASCVVLVTLVAAIASYLPARRAARVDPMVALRAE